MKIKELIAQVLQSAQALNQAVMKLEAENAALKEQLGEKPAPKKAKVTKPKAPSVAKDVKTGTMKTVKPATKETLPKAELPKVATNKVVKSPPTGPIKPVEPAKIIDSATGTAVALK